MNKFTKTTLGRKLLAFYLVFFAISFFCLYSLGYSYLRNRVYYETESELRSLGITLMSAHLNEDALSKKKINSLYPQLRMASDAAECRILLISNDGEVQVDSEVKHPDYNIYNGDASFLHQQTIRNFTMSGYLTSQSSCVCLPMEKSSHLNGYIFLAKNNKEINSRAYYYTNVLAVFFYLKMLLVALFFIFIYIFNVRPLTKLRNGAKDFSIRHENPPILIKSNDEYGELAQTLNVIGDELSKFDEYQRKFISNISHDFRSPLTNIQGYVQAMADGIIPVEEQDKYLSIILNETDRLTKLTTNLLDLNRYDKDNIMLDISDFDIQDAIQTTCDSLESSARTKGMVITFNKTLNESLFVNGDKNKILQVLHNLLDNAIKFSDTQSCVEVSLKVQHERVLISVKDYGIGIPKDEIPHIFDRFYKTDLSRGKDKHGTGLGLSICREIINAHKQTIDVVSTVGVGSEFIFTLNKA